MEVTFRQGIVQIPKDTNGTQLFLQSSGSYVNLVATSGSTTVHFAHRQSNYLHVEHNSTNNAWGPFSGTDTVWLYWDIDQRTGLRTFSHTDFEPVAQTTPPTTPAAGQMWFDTVNSVMMEFTGTGWMSVVRVIAAQYTNSAIIEPWNAGSVYEGTQVGDFTSNDAGVIIYDESDLPLKRSNKTFFTSTDKLTAGINVVSSINIEALQFDAEATENMAAHTVVALRDFGLVEPARYSNISDTVYGIILDSVIVGQRVTVVTSGVIVNPSWNWPTANALLYYDENGQLTTTVRPGITPVGFVIEPTRVLLKPFNTGSITTNSTTNQSVQAYPSVSGTVNINTALHWHTIEQNGVIDLNFDVPTGATVDRFNIEIISNGDTINWPGNGGSFTIPAGATKVFNVTYRPETQGIDAKFIITEQNLV